MRPHAAAVTPRLGVKCPYSGLERDGVEKGTTVRFCAVCDCFGLSEEDAIAAWAERDARGS